MKKLYLLFIFISIGVNAQGSLCTDPIVIASLPYTTTDNTANYVDNYDPQTDTSPECAATPYGNEYHSGNDVIYAYTAQNSGTIKAEIPAALAWTGMFIYNDCADIGVTYAACATGPSNGIRTISDFAVTAGITYYIYISSWSTPQTVAYTLNVTQQTLGTDDVYQNRNIILFPNPVNDMLFLDTSLAIKKIRVYNVNGQQMEVRLSGNNEVPTGHLQSGFYILELTTDEGAKMYKKFVKSGR
jgi:hypothetical protein